VGSSAAQFDIAIIGAGIAGTSVASELSSHCRVILLESESQPGYHTTGRSAALFAETYGPPPVRALTRASAGFFKHPPIGLSSEPLLSPRGVVMVAREDQLLHLENLIADISQHGSVARLDADELQRLVPLFRRKYAAAGLYDPHSMDIDVSALHQGYLHQLNERGGKLVTDAEVVQLSRLAGNWQLATRTATITANIIINAAGAWADHVGELAGAVKINLVPKRRTAIIVNAPDGVETDDLPAVVDVQEQFYLKPGAGRLLISPADETPSAPCDAQPEELDIAIGIERIENAFDLNIDRVENQWAGLRSFVADKCPVTGFDTQAEHFFWLAGQGGYGIQSAPALARLACSLVLEHKLPQDILDQGLNIDDLHPDRLEGRCLSR
jgi:D-arginine dehydrogenase